MTCSVQFTLQCSTLNNCLLTIHQNISPHIWGGRRNFFSNNAFPFSNSTVKIVSLSNYDDDDDDDFKKKIGLMIKTTALHVHHAFSTFLWRPLHDYGVKPSNLTFYGGRGHTTTNFPSSFWTWIKSLRIQLQEKSPAFDILSGSKQTRLSLKERKLIS